MLCPDRREESSSGRSLSVVIPAYNEEARLAQTVLETDAFLRDQGYEAEIIIVDDGSIDHTRQVSEDLQRRVPGLRVIGYDRNRGKGFAVKTGFLAARRDAVLFSDADHSTHISQLNRLWPWYDRGYAIVIGSRALKDSSIVVRQPLSRRIMGRTFNMILATLGLRGIRDSQCGFKLFRKDSSGILFRRLKTEGFAFDVELLLRARDAGLRIAEVGVRWENSPASHVHALRDPLKMLLDVCRMRGFL